MKAATAGLSLVFMLLGVSGLDMFVIVIAIAEVDEDEVSTLITFVGTVTVGFYQQDRESSCDYYLQDEPARLRFIRSNDSLASLVPFTMGRAFDARIATCVGPEFVGSEPVN